MTASDQPMFPPEIQAQLDRLREEYDNRPRYDRFDLEILASIPDEALEQALLDYLFGRLERFNHDQDAAFAGLSVEFRAFYCSWEIEAEVLNGGFNQYFWNSSSQNAERAVAALREQGDATAADLVEQAIRVAIVELPEMCAYLKAGTIEAFSESYKFTSLNDFDEPFWRRAEVLPALRIAYVRSHAEAFVTPWSDQ